MSTVLYKGTANSGADYTLLAPTGNYLIIKSIYIEFAGTFTGNRVVQVTTQDDIVLFYNSLSQTQRVIIDELHIPVVTSTTLNGIKVKTSATTGDGGIKVVIHGVVYSALSQVDNTNFAIPKVFFSNAVTSTTSAPVVPTGKNIIIKDIYVFNPHASPGSFAVGIETDTTIGSASYFSSDLSGNGNALLTDLKLVYRNDADRLKFFQNGSTNMTFVVTGWENNNSAI